MKNWQLTAGIGQSLLFIFVVEFRNQFKTNN